MLFSKPTTFFLLFASGLSWCRKSHWDPWGGTVRVSVAVRGSTVRRGLGVSGFGLKGLKELRGGARRQSRVLCSRASWPVKGGDGGHLTLKTVLEYAMAQYTIWQNTSRKNRERLLQLLWHAGGSLVLVEVPQARRRRRWRSLEADPWQCMLTILHSHVLILTWSHSFHDLKGGHIFGL